METVADVTDVITTVPTVMANTIRQEVNPLLGEVRAGVAEMRAGVAALDKAAAKPALSDHQVRTIVLPGLLGLIKPLGMILGAVLIVAAIGVGVGLQWLMTPTLTCGPDHGGVSCGYWKVPPTEPAPAAAVDAPSVKAPARKP